MKRGWWEINEIFNRFFLSGTFTVIDSMVAGRNANSRKICFHTPQSREDTHLHIILCIQKHSVGIRYRKPVFTMVLQIIKPPYRAAQLLHAKSTWLLWLINCTNCSLEFNTKSQLSNKRMLMRYTAGFASVPWRANTPRKYEHLNTITWSVENAEIAFSLFNSSSGEIFSQEDDTQQHFARLLPEPL